MNLQSPVSLERNPISLRSPLDLALERHLRTVYGKDVRCRYVADLFPGKTRSRKIQYIQYQSTGPHPELFVKYAARLRVNSELESFLSSTNSPDFATPRFFGTGKVDGATFAVWEKVPQKMMGTFSHCDLRPIVDAIVAINDLTDEGREHLPSTQIRTLWVEPRFEAASEAVRELQADGAMDIKSVRKHLQLLRKVEARTLGRLKELGDGFLSHNDIAPANIIFEPQMDKPFILDWELASVSVPGASLRGFALLEPAVQHELTLYYTASMNGKGYKVDARDVFLVMGAMQVYYELSTGIAGKNPKTLLRGLQHVPSLIADRL